MFDGFNEALKHNMIMHATILQLMVSKGLVTVEEFERTKMQATAAVDQSWEVLMEEKAEEFKRENPSMFKLLGMMELDESEP